MAEAGRLLLLLPDLAHGGAQRVLLQLAAAFADAGREVHLASVVAGGPLGAEIPHEVSYHGLVPAGSWRDSLLLCRALPALRKRLHSLAPDAVLASVTGTNLLASLARATFSGRLVLREAVAAHNLRSSAWRFAVRRLYRRADAWIAVSAGVSSDLRAFGLPQAAITVIPNPLDAKRLRVLAKAAPPGPAADRPYVISIGRLVPQKGHDLLLRAFARSRLRDTHRLLLVGEGPQRSALKALIDTLRLDGRAILIGELRNPYPLLSSAALFVLASRWEGYPNALLEALALGVPVVATDCPHGPAEILDAGRYGRLVPTEDPEALARAMEGELSQRSPPAESVIRAHRMDVIAQRYLAVLDGRA